MSGKKQHDRVPKNWPTHMPVCASLDAIDVASDLDQLRSHALKALAIHLGAVTASLWKFNEDDGSVTLDLEYASGEVVSRNRSGFSHAERFHFDPDHQASYKKHHRLIAGETLILDVATSDMFVANEREHLLNAGTATLIVIPLAAAKRHLGRMAIGFADRREFRATEAAFTTTLANQIALILEACRLSDSAKEAAVERERLAGLAAVSEERNRLAGEIHDNLAQSFAGIAMQLESAEDAAEHGETETALSSAQRTRDLARFGLAEARRSVLALRPTMALAGGLAAAVRSLAERTRVRGLLDCQSRVVGMSEPMPADTELQLFRIAQEAVSNAVRHGRPKAIAIMLRYASDEVGLEVIDDGAGIDPNRERDPSGGLMAMSLRAKSLGGSFEILPSGTQGTQIAVRVPLKRGEA